jgi:hypothetical protein
MKTSKNNLEQKLEDNLEKNGRQPKKNWKTTSNKNGRRPQTKMEDDLKQKWNTTSSII